MKDDRTLKRSDFLLVSSLGLAGCSNAAFSPLSPLALMGQATRRRLRNYAVTGPGALLQGYNSVLGNGCSTALTGNYATNGAESSVVCTVCTTASQVAKALEIDASLSVAYGPFASFDAKTKFMSSLDITTYSITIVVHAKHSIGKEQFTDVRLKDGIASPVTAEETNDFVRIYGDSWISEISKGGEYFATYTFFSETRTEQQELQVSMRASGLVSGVSVEAGLQAKMNQFVSTSNVSSTFKQTITGIRNPPLLPDPSDFVPFARKFPSLELTSPTIIGFASKGYESGVAGFSAPFFKEVAANRRYFTMGDADKPSLASDLATIGGIRKQMHAIKQIYDFYGYTGDPELPIRQQAAKTDYDAIVEQVQRFETAATSSFTRPSLPSLQNGTPVLTYSLASSTDFGGDGGNAFNDVDVRTYLQKRTRIAEVQLRTGGMVDNIATTYEDANGISWTKSAGGGGGTLGSPLQLLPGQSVTSVVGYADSVMYRLKVAISDGRYVQGGSIAGRVFLITAPRGAIVMGFHGRAGAIIYKIGLDYAYLKPAKWDPV